MRHCDLWLYPNKKKINTLSFTINNSPLKFSNRLAYSRGVLGSLVRIENTFYVSTITNYPQSSILEYKYETFCGEDNFEQEPHFKIKSPDSFYIKYPKNSINMKH